MKATTATIVNNKVVQLVRKQTITFANKTIFNKM